MADSYNIRSLEASELDKYYDFLTAVFAFKPAPRSLFVRHVESDPHLDLDTIYIAEDANGAFAATLRVFHRALHDGGDGPDLKFGGIGEGECLNNTVAYGSIAVAGVLRSMAVNWGTVT